jgi:hypothetical protein
VVAEKPKEKSAANAEAAAVATWKAPSDVPGRPNQASLRLM